MLGPDQTAVCRRNQPSKRPHAVADASVGSGVGRRKRVKLRRALRRVGNGVDREGENSDMGDSDKAWGHQRLSQVSNLLLRRRVRQPAVPGPEKADSNTQAAAASGAESRRSARNLSKITPDQRSRR